MNESLCGCNSIQCFGLQATIASAATGFLCTILKKWNVHKINCSSWLVGVFFLFFFVYQDGRQFCGAGSLFIFTSFKSNNGRSTCVSLWRTVLSDERGNTDANHLQVYICILSATRHLYAISWQVTLRDIFPRCILQPDLILFFLFLFY